MSVKVEVAINVVYFPFTNAASWIFSHHWVLFLVLWQWNCFTIYQNLTPPRIVNETHSAHEAVFYTVQRSEHVTRGTPDHPCHKGEGTSVTQCYHNYMERTMGCRLPWGRNENRSYEVLSWVFHCQFLLLKTFCLHRGHVTGRQTVTPSRCWAANCMREETMMAQPSPDASRGVAKISTKSARCWEGRMSISEWRDA